MSIPASGAVHQTLEVALTALQLSPLDALYLAEGNEQAQRSELEQRLVFHLLRSRPPSVPGRSGSSSALYAGSGLDGRRGQLR